MMLEQYLADLEARLDDSGETEHLESWKRFWVEKNGKGIFKPKRNYAPPSALQWPSVLINDAIADHTLELMMLRELKVVSDRLAAGAGGMFNVRANYGTGILPSLFGARVFTMDRDIDTLPTTYPMGAEGTIGLLKHGVPNTSLGYGAKVMEFTRKFKTLTAPYPKVSKWVRQYHPDIQSPMDAMELLYGSQIFYAVYDDADTIQALLRLVTDTYRAFLEKWLETVDGSSDIKFGGTGDLYTAHWGMLVKGRLMLRCDSAMNFSPEMYDQFIVPYDRELLATMGGGAMHFCGKGDHYIDSLCRSPGLTGINMSQPEYNDMERIFSATVDKGYKILGIPVDAPQARENAGRSVRGNVAVI
jgi:hypothetical protein